MIKQYLEQKRILSYEWAAAPIHKTCIKSAVSHNNAGINVLIEPITIPLDIKRRK